MAKIFVVVTTALFGGVREKQVRVFATQALAASYQARTPNSAIIALDNACDDGENAYITFHASSFGGNPETHRDMDTATAVARFYNRSVNNYVKAYGFVIIN